MIEDRKRDRAEAGIAAGKLDRLIQTLSPDLRAELRAIWTEEQHAAGDILLHEDQDNGTIGYVLDGLLGMVKELTDGRRHIIGLLVPNDMYGRAFEGTSGYQVEALADTTVLTCKRERFEDLIARSPVAERLFMVSVLDELDAAREWVIVLGGPKIVQRLASFLFILCRRQRRDAKDAGRAVAPINLKLSIKRRDLAHYLGARPESLSRAFHELDAAGVIRMNDPYDFDVMDLPGLIEAAGQDLVLDEDF